MRIHRLGLSVAMTAAALVAGTTGVLAQTDDDDVVITVVERAESDATIDIGDQGDSLGDLLAFGNDLYDEANAVLVGRDQGTCVRTNPGESWECTFTVLLEDGSLTVQGPFYDDLRDTELAITGGTGAYAEAGGTMRLRSLDPAGEVLEFVFDVRRDDDAEDGDGARDDDDDDDATDAGGQTDGPDQTAADATDGGGQTDGPDRTGQGDGTDGGGQTDGPDRTG